MEVQLTWDLIVVVFFAIVMAYSFIVGKDESVKIIIASYIAIVSVQAIGNLLEMFLGETETAESILGFTLNQNIISTIKLVIFVLTIITLSISGGFDTQYRNVFGNTWELILTGIFGFATSGLLLSALLTYIGGRPILDEELASAPLLTSILQESTLMQIMVEYQNVWFALPAVVLIIVGIFSDNAE